MIVVMNIDSNIEEITTVKERLETMGFQNQIIHGVKKIVIGAVGDPLTAGGRAAFVLASLGLTALYRQGRRGCLRILHAEFPSRPAL